MYQFYKLYEAIPEIEKVFNPVGSDNDPNVNINTMTDTNKKKQVQMVNNFLGK